MFLDINRIKRHLNIDDYYNDDDIYLSYLADVAEKVVEKHTDMKLDDIAKENGGELPPPILHAMLLFIGDMYKTRESITFGSVTSIPFSYDYILSLYKNYRSNLI